MKESKNDVKRTFDTIIMIYGPIIIGALIGAGIGAVVFLWNHDFTAIISGGVFGLMVATIFQLAQMIK